VLLEPRKLQIGGWRAQQLALIFLIGTTGLDECFGAVKTDFIFWVG
jgi:hypothetical protein